MLPVSVPPGVLLLEMSIWLTPALYPRRVIAVPLAETLIAPSDLELKLPVKAVLGRLKVLFPASRNWPLDVKNCNE